MQGDSLLLVSARAVDDAYPLYGTIEMAPERFAAAVASARGPPPGELWVEGQVLDRLGVAPAIGSRWATASCASAAYCASCPMSAPVSTA